MDPVSFFKENIFILGQGKEFCHTNYFVVLKSSFYHLHCIGRKEGDLVFVNF